MPGDDAAHRSRDLADRRWPQLDGTHVVVLVPVGSLEQHGPHLPLATDTMIADAVAHGAADRLLAAGVPVVVAPAIGYGASGEHEDFPGTISIGHAALRLLVVECARSACRWATGVVFVNGHGGNVAALQDAVDQLRREGRQVIWHACVPPHGDAHAGRTETSLVWHLAPGAVAGDRAEAGARAPLPELMLRLRRDGVRAVAPNGVLGDPTDASSHEGELLLARLVDDLVAVVRDVHPWT
ncbi:MAG: mycofactocin biosynthesis peptidyl-dipeptidase MftE [Actinobacteria bacterium]|nr:mycofactocin biosynthesis peptidyl-dipeptidase MftE [Actinomycetota bacterium]